MFKKIALSLLLGWLLTARVLAQGVDYYLPDPGILPDHPLYWLKMIRDRVGLMLVVNETDKAEKILLYADKRLGAAWALVDGNKPALGVSTLTKAEKYLEQAVRMGGNEAFQQKLAKAVAKHEEVVKIIKPKLETIHSSAIDEILIKLEQLRPAPAPSSQTEIYLEATENDTAYGILDKTAREKGWEIVTQNYNFGMMVESIAAIANSREKAWIYYVNGKAGDKAADKFSVKAGDKVEWKYEAVKP